jgi:maltose alpha-D-glucosyltransferase / alpha-amylase
VIRYGDEIGMGDDLTLKERDAVRTPMQWTAEPQAGFSTSAKTVHPVIAKGPYRYDQVNVEAQRRDPGSLLNWTTHMIRLRKECPEIGWGDWRILPTGSPAVLAMRYDWRGNSLVVVHNFDEKAHEIRITPEAQGGEKLLNLLVEDESRADARGTHRIALEAYGYRWYRVGNLSHVLHRRKE